MFLRCKNNLLGHLSPAPGARSSAAQAAGGPGSMSMGREGSSLRALGHVGGLSNSRQHFPPLSKGNALLLLSRFHVPIWFSGQPPSPPPSPHHPTTSTL